MLDFDLGGTYDSLTCMFGAIAYLQSVAELRVTLSADLPDANVNKHSVNEAAMERLSPHEPRGPANTG